MDQRSLKEHKLEPVHPKEWALWMAALSRPDSTEGVVSQKELQEIVREWKRTPVIFAKVEATQKGWASLILQDRAPLFKLSEKKTTRKIVLHNFQEALALMANLVKFGVPQKDIIFCRFKEGSWREEMTNMLGSSET